MKSAQIIRILIIVFLFSQPYRVLAQDSTAVVEGSKSPKSLKNTVRFNISNPIIFGERSIIFGYERTLGKHQSFSINLGQASFGDPKNISKFAGPITLERTGSTRGYHASFDYRFYLRKENKYVSPRGVYIGPYYSYNYFERNSTWVLNSPSFQGSFDSKLRIDMHSVGFELGYQFVIWRRLAIDLVLFGPGTIIYSINASASSSLSETDKETLYNAISDMLAERFPGYEFALKPRDFEKSGSMSTTSLGFRYLIQFGFRF